MSAVPFVEFPKIPRLKRDIVVTEKIDGTNASILVPEDEAEYWSTNANGEWALSLVDRGATLRQSAGDDKKGGA